MMNDVETIYDIILITYYGSKIYEEVSKPYEDIDDARADAIYFSESGNYDRVILRRITYDIFGDCEGIDDIYNWNKEEK